MTTREELRKEVLRLIAENSTLKNQLKQAEVSTAMQCAEMLRTQGVFLTIIPGETKADHVARFARAFADKIERKFDIQQGGEA